MTTFTPTTELELIERITHTECAQCGVRGDADAEAIVDGGNEDIDDLMSLSGPCGCDDPVPNFFIVSDEPLFGRADIDDDFEIPVRRHWEYQVDHDLASRLGVSA